MGHHSAGQDKSVRGTAGHTKAGHTKTGNTKAGYTKAGLPPGRFTSSMMTYSLNGRVALTALTLLIGLVLLPSLVSDARADDPRPAALVFFLFGIWAFVAWRFLRHLWRPGTDWLEERRTDDLEREGIRSKVEDLPRTHLNFTTFHPAAEDASTEPESD